MCVMERLKTITEKFNNAKDKSFNTFSDFWNDLKPELIGKNIDGIFIDDYIHFNNYAEYEFDEKIDRKLYWDKNAIEDVELELDDGVMLKIGNIYLKVYPAYSEKEYCKFEISENFEQGFVNISHYYSKNIIGRKIVDIYTEDYFNVNMVLDNGYEFCFEVLFWNNIKTRERIFKQNRQKIDYKKMHLSHYYEKYSALSKFLESIKKYFIGKKIKKIMRLGYIYSFEGKEIELDEFIDICAEDNHLNIEFTEESEAFAGLNLFDYTELSEIDNFSWRSMNAIYKDHIINQVIKDIVLTKRDISGETDKEYIAAHSDDFDEIKIILENGYVFNITNDLDYTITNEYSQRRYLMMKFLKLMHLKPKSWSLY